MDRGIELLKAAAEWLGQKDFTELTTTVYYDGAECDGNCLLEDIKTYLEEVEYSKCVLTEDDIDEAEVMTQNSNSKPDCKLIGEDGNVFNLIKPAVKPLA